MSFKQFDNEDVIVSADSISSTVWSTGTYSLSTFYTSSTQEAATSGDYYLNVYQTGSEETNSAIQFSIAYGERNGLGSTLYNSNVSGKSPSATVYGQYRSLVLGDEDSNFLFSGHISARGIYAISIDRARYKEKLLPGTFNIVLADAGGTLHLTDNSGQSTTVTYNDAGRVYELISGSNGTAYTGTGLTANNGSYGKFLPDVGLVLLNVDALLDGTDGLGTAGAFSGFKSGSDASTGPNGHNNALLFGALDYNQGKIEANSEETVSSNYIFVRVRNGEFNYSNNPSNISGSGELRHNSMVNNPQAYITTVGLYNDSNDLLGVAKLSKPLLKDFTKEALIRIKLDY